MMLIQAYIWGLLIQKKIILQRKLPQNHRRPWTSIFLEIGKNPTPIKGIGVPTPSACQIISFVDYGDYNEDLHGYESDGAKGPFIYGIVDEMEYDLFVEDKNPPMLMGGKGCDHDKYIRNSIPLSESKIKAFIVSELKSELRRRGIRMDLKGNKVMFRYQLTKEINEKKSIQTEDDANAKCLKSFPEGTKWKPLKTKEEAVIEPDHTFLNARAPTVPRTDKFKVPVNHKFDVSFA